MLEFACHTWSFPDLTLPESFGTMARLGFRYADVGSGNGWNMARSANPQTRAQALREWQADLKTFNLRVADLCVLLPRISLNDEARRTADIQLFKALMPFAKACGARGITVSAGVLHGEDDPQARDRSVEALREFVASASDVGLPISLEPLVGSMVQTPADALAMLADVEGLGITLDWAQLIYHKGIGTEDILPLLPHTRHVQLRQAMTGRLQSSHDKGRIDFEEVFRALADVSYDGIVTVKLLPPSAHHGVKALNPITEVVALRDALRTLRDASGAFF